MFLIYINELLAELAKYNITVKAFADDVKLYLQIMDDLDVTRLQLAVIDVGRRYIDVEELRWRTGQSRLR